MVSGSLSASDGRVCVDANVIVHALGTRVAPTLAETVATWVRSGWTFHVPTLWRYEVTNAVYRASNAGRVDPNDLPEVLRTIWALPLTYYDEILDHECAAVIALRLTAGAAYDAHYLALVERLNIPFYTSDVKLYGPISKFFPNIELVPVE